MFPCNPDELWILKFIYFLLILSFCYLQPANANCRYQKIYCAIQFHFQAPLSATHKCGFLESGDSIKINLQNRLPTTRNFCGLWIVKVNKSISDYKYHSQPAMHIVDCGNPNRFFLKSISAIPFSCSNLDYLFFEIYGMDPFRHWDWLT